MCKINFILTSLCLFVLAEAPAQNVGIGTISPNASAQLDVNSTTKGLLAPRMTQAQRNAISNPAQGLLVYQTDGTTGFYVNRSAVPAVPNWSVLAEGANQWLPGLITNSIYNANPGNVGIATASPGYPLTVQATGIGIAQQSPDASTQIGFYTTNGAAFIQTHTNHDMLFATNNGSAQMTLKTTGNLGVGTSSPTSKLDVAGTFRATGNAVFGGTIQIQGGSPAAGRVLTSDAGGNATWQAPDVSSCFQNMKELSFAGVNNWTVPAGVTKIWVEMWGGGGTGSKYPFGYLGGGGGAGAYSCFFVTVTPGSTVTATITSGSGNYTEFSYGGDFIRTYNGENGSTGTGPGRGGTFTRGGVNFSLNVFYSGGEDGLASSYGIQEDEAGAKNAVYRGGKGGDAYKGKGGCGDIYFVNFGSSYTTGLNRGLAGTPKGFGSGGGAKVSYPDGGSVAGVGGAVFIYY